MNLVDEILLTAMEKNLNFFSINLTATPESGERFDFFHSKSLKGFTIFIHSRKDVDIFDFQDEGKYLAEAREYLLLYL